MTATLYILAMVAAVGDWLAVWKRYFRIEYVLKPATLVLLILAAASTDLPSVKGWVLAALVLSLIGDVALMLAREDDPSPDGAFLTGVAAFLLAHLCYLAAFTIHGVHGVQAIAGALVVAGVAALSLPRVLVRARRLGGQEFMAVIAAYSGIVGLMTVFAVGTASVLTATGGLLFLVSDTVLAHDRFVRRLPNGPVLVAVTYHLAQLLIVLGLR